MTKQETNALNELIKIIDELVGAVNKMICCQVILIKALVVLGNDSIDSDLDNES